MTYVEAPGYHRPAPTDPPAIFLAGGISVTVQPIALFELGAASANPARRIVVGAADGYPRRVDIVLQLAHARPALTVHSTLDATLADIRSQLTVDSGALYSAGADS